MIRLVVFDIDGVITDGTVIVDVNGTEQKKINLKDVDAIFELHREGFRLAAITGEKTEIVFRDFCSISCRISVFFFAPQ